jgi:uncharacterized coiled-coil DUF342 family protein
MKTQIERLTKEFQELDRITPRPLTHEDYAITAIQFANDLFKESHPAIMKQLEKAGDDYGKLIICFEEIDAVKKQRDEYSQALDRQIAEFEDLKKAYELKQEHNISLVEELDDLKAHLKHVVSHYKGILKNDEFNCPACFQDIKSCDCKQQQEEHAKNFGGI